MSVLRSPMSPRATLTYRKPNQKSELRPMATVQRLPKKKLLKRRQRRLKPLLQHDQRQLQPLPHHLLLLPQQQPLLHLRNAQMAESLPRHMPRN